MALARLKRDENGALDDRVPLAAGKQTKPSGYASGLCALFFKRSRLS